jgi:UrcA family protein
MTKISLLLLAAATSVTALAPAAQASETRAVAVDHSDLDLAKPTDRARLNDRVRRAAVRVCPQLGLDLKVNQEVARCRSAAAAHAAPQVRAAINSAVPDLDRARFAASEGSERS